MRSETDPEKVQRLMRELGRLARGPGRVYFTGGVTALLLGWRHTTVDADLRLDPEPPGIFEAISRLKDELDMNIELASPQDFIPELPEWRDRSVLIRTEGAVHFYHYDFYAQALAKIERGHARDLRDILEMRRRDLILPSRLQELFDAITPQLLRYPAIDPDAFARKLQAALQEMRAKNGASDGEL